VQPVIRTCGLWDAVKRGSAEQGARRGGKAGPGWGGGGPAGPGRAHAWPRGETAYRRITGPDL